MTHPLVVMYTDGACSPNPGVGGWGAVLVAPEHNGHTRRLSGGEARSTNNRMELTAAIEGLRALKRASRVRLVTDSRYLQQAFTEGWLEKWQANGWRNSSRKPVQNVDLWQELVVLAELHEIEWEWVKGHAGNPGNTEADALAVAAREQIRRRLEG